MIPTALRSHVCEGLVTLVVLLGCAGSRREPSAPSRSASAPSPPPPISASWSEYELSGEGLYARFPAEPVDALSTPWNGIGIHGLALAGRGSMSFGCGRSEPLEFGPGPSTSERVSLAQSMAPGLFSGSPVPSAARRLRDLNGEMLTGEDRNGNAQILVAYRLGNGLLMAWVTGHGKDLDPGAASQFFASLRLDVPWQVRALPELGLSVAVPRLVAEDTKPGEVDFVFGGVDNLGYTVSARRAAAGASPREAIAEAAASSGNKVRSSADIEHDGMPGKDVTLAQGVGFVRAQFFAANGLVYRTTVASTSLDRLVDSDARRFFESLRIF